MADWMQLAGAWLLGASSTMAALTTMGEKSRQTYGDSYSGDTMVDTICVALWPLFWPCWLAFHLGRWLTTKLSKGND